MPELPEVHALVSDLGSRLTGRRLEGFTVVSFAALKTFDPPPAALSNSTISGVHRFGKFLDIAVWDTELGELHLVIHLARSGWIRWRDGAAPTPARISKGPLAARLIVVGEPAQLGGEALATGSGFDITEAGPKKNLAIYIVRSPLQVAGIAALGSDPLDENFTPQKFASILAAAGRSQIKGVLRNQSIIAGIGNAYSDEILHAAKMSPFTPATMDEVQVSHLYDALQSTLRTAIHRSVGLTASELKQQKKSAMQVHGRTGEACPVCGDVVRQVTYADSSLQYCPTCQTGGKPLADRVLSRLLK